MVERIIIETPQSLYLITKLCNHNLIMFFQSVSMFIAIPKHSSLSDITGKAKMSGGERSPAGSIQTKLHNSVLKLWTHPIINIFLLITDLNNLHISL